MASKKIGVIISILFTCSIFAKAAGFEGRIVMSRQTLYDTTLYEFSVKDSKVRLDIKNSFAQTIQRLIIDLESEKITALSPIHKLYTILKKQYRTTYNKEDYELIKTPNFKLIDGYKCYLWHVRNKAMNSDVTFWISMHGFDFFPKVMKLLSYTEDYSDISNYYMQVEQDSTFFPILIQDRTLLKEEKIKMVVMKINSEPVSDKVFEIPKDYQLLRY